MLQFTLNWIAYGNPKQVFNALTQVDAIEKWSGQKAVFDTKLNTYQWFDWVSGTIEIYEPNTHLQLSWKPKTWGKKMQPAIVNLLFKPHEAGTLISLTHSNLTNDEELNNSKNGWIDMVFDPLNDYLIG